MDFKLKQRIIQLLAAIEKYFSVSNTVMDCNQELAIAKIPRVFSAKAPFRIFSEFYCDRGVLCDTVHVCIRIV